MNLFKKGTIKIDDRGIIRIEHEESGFILYYYPNTPSYLIGHRFFEDKVKPVLYEFTELQPTISKYELETRFINVFEGTERYQEGIQLFEYLYRKEIV